MILVALGVVPSKVIFGCRKISTLVVFTAEAASSLTPFSFGGGTLVLVTVDAVLFVEGSNLDGFTPNRFWVFFSLSFSSS